MPEKQQVINRLHLRHSNFYEMELLAKFFESNGNSTRFKAPSAKLKMNKSLYRNHSIIKAKREELFSLDQACFNNLEIKAIRPRLCFCSRILQELSFTLMKKFHSKT